MNSNVIDSFFSILESSVYNTFSPCLDPSYGILANLYLSFYPLSLYTTIVILDDFIMMIEVDTMI
jgi:hypothetical protein